MTHYTPLSEPIAAAIRPVALTLRIIVLALALGVLAFGLFSVQSNAAKPQVVGEQLSLPLLLFGLAAIPAGLLLPRFLFRSGMNRIAALPPPANPAEELDLARAIQQQIQTTTIIGCALWEGGAFANLIQYMTAVELVHLGVAAFLFLLILSRFPWPGRCEGIIADEMRRIKEERGVRRAA